MWKDKGLQLVMLQTNNNKANKVEYSLLLGESCKVYLPQTYKGD